MRARHLTERGTILATLMTGLLWAASAGAQSGRPWVDPPSGAETPPTSPPAGPPAASAPEQPRRTDAPDGGETRSGPPADSPPEPTQASPVPRAPATPAPTRTERAAPPSEARPRPDETAPGPRPSPPARSAEPPRSPQPEAPASGERRQRSADYAGAAQNLAVAYLAYWSAPNAITLEATPDFYAPQILFHGRQMSARALFEEKRRFVRRWPVREYHPRPETMRTTCDPAPPICTVRTMFDFAASSPQTGKRSQGTALLQLGVSFSGEEPMIVFESSQVTSRSPSARSDVFEDADND